MGQDTLSECRRDRPGYPVVATNPDVGNRCGKENEHHSDLATTPEAVVQIFQSSVDTSTPGHNLKAAHCIALACCGIMSEIWNSYF